MYQANTKKGCGEEGQGERRGVGKEEEDKGEGWG